LQRTFRTLHAAQAIADLLLTGFGLPSLSSPAADLPLFLDLESAAPERDVVVLMAASVILGDII
jgi:hypothetical protein